MIVKHLDERILPSARAKWAGLSDAARRMLAAARRLVSRLRAPASASPMPATTSTSRSASRAIVADLYAALAERDTGRVRVLLAPHVSAAIPRGQAVVGGHYAGAENLLSGLWGRLGEHWQALTPNVARWIDGPDGEVVTIGRYTATNTTTGHALDAGFVHVWSTDAGRVTRLEVQTDTALWNRAWGRPLPPADAGAP